RRDRGCRAAPHGTDARSLDGRSRPSAAGPGLRRRGVWNSRRALRGQQLGLMLGYQRIDDLAQCLALDHLRQLVEREVDAVVADAALWKIVGADALGAV